MPATGSSADSSPNVAQENEAAPVMLPHAIRTVAFGYAWKYRRKLKEVETSMGFFRNRISPQPTGKPSTGGNISYVHRIRCARSLQFSAIRERRRQDDNEQGFRVNGETLHRTNKRHL